MDIFWLVIKIILKAAAALLLFAAAVAVFLFRMAICRKTRIPFQKRRRAEETPVMKAYREGAEQFAASPYETHTISSYDGLKLAGHYLPAELEEGQQSPAFILLCMHGYRSSSLKEYGIYMPFYHDALKADVMAPDERAHGESEGKYICYGVKERFDVLYWVDYINRLSEKRYGEILPVYIQGISMGCSTVLMAYGLGYPENVKGIIADCGYTSPESIFRNTIHKKFHFPCFPILNIAEWISKIFADFGFTDASVPEAVRTADKRGIPILFIHGDQDFFVPTNMGIQNYEACTGSKKLLLVKGAAHAVSYFTDRDAYEAAVKELILSPQTF